MDFLYLYDIEQRNLLQLGALSGVGRRDRAQRDGEHDLANVQYKPVWNCHSESPCTMNIA
jgi:hypothetical protein